VKTEAAAAAADAAAEAAAAAAAATAAAAAAVHAGKFNGRFLTSKSKSPRQMSWAFLFLVYYKYFHIFNVSSKQKLLGYEDLLVFL
jgi:hypothetical protein